MTERHAYTDDKRQILQFTSFHCCPINQFWHFLFVKYMSVNLFYYEYKGAWIHHGKKILHEHFWSPRLNWEAACGENVPLGRFARLWGIVMGSRGLVEGCDEDAAHLLQQVERRGDMGRWLWFYRAGGAGCWRWTRRWLLEQRVNVRTSLRPRREWVQRGGDMQLEVIIHWNIWGEHLEVKIAHFLKGRKWDTAASEKAHLRVACTAAKRKGWSILHLC